MLSDVYCIVKVVILFIVQYYILHLKKKGYKVRKFICKWIWIYGNENIFHVYTKLFHSIYILVVLIYSYKNFEFQNYVSKISKNFMNSMLYGYIVQ